LASSWSWPHLEETVVNENRSRFLDVAALVLAGVATLGLVVRWTVRDGLPYASSLFYALPYIVVTALMLAAGVVWLRNRRPAAALACAAGALLAGALWVSSSWFGNECRSTDGRLRVVTWNTARGFAGWSRIAAWIDATDADVVGLVEAGGSTEGWERFWREHFPQHQAYLAGGGLVVLTRGRILEGHTLRLPGQSTCADVQIDFGGRSARVLLADAVVRPFANRREVVEKVFELARRTPGTATIVMGDFNTPIDSVWFDAARRDFSHAFEAGGHGMLTTWPVPAPILAIDHVWLSGGIQVDCASVGWSWLSDHRPIIVDLSLPQEGSE
jgi:endonuclease/exonuclease/phosphatase (EEP) superfamily protein YafD